MKGAQCMLNLLMLSLPPCLTLLEPQCQVSHVAATSAPPLPSERAWAEEGGGGEVSSWPIVYKKRFTLAKCIPRLLPFLYTSSHCAVLPLVKEAEAVPEKLLLPVPISTFGVRISHCQGAPLPGRLLLASYKQQQWECKSSLSPSILSVYPSPTGHDTIWGSWIFRSAICFP